VIEAFLTARELAELLGVDQDWVYARAASGELPSYRLGTIRRFRESEVEEWLQSHREGGSRSSVATPENVRALRR
jgi:excisionase family DNA binding protein